MLSSLEGLPLKKTLILDNNPANFVHNLRNAVPIIPYLGDKDSTDPKTETKIHRAANEHQQTRNLSKASKVSELGKKLSIYDIELVKLEAYLISIAQIDEEI